MGNARRYTDEQVNRANAVDLEYYLRSRGETLRPAGSEYVWV